MSCCVEHRFRSNLKASSHMSRTVPLEMYSTHIQYKSCLILFVLYFFYPDFMKDVDLGCNSKQLHFPNFTHVFTNCWRKKIYCDEMFWCHVHIFSLNFWAKLLRWQLKKHNWYSSFKLIHLMAVFQPQPLWNNEWTRGFLQVLPTCVNAAQISLNSFR